ncbi:hypothetical protein VQ056_08740 [Paenibacillus sp. JTLBN-2024]
MDIRIKCVGCQQQRSDSPRQVRKKHEKSAPLQKCRRESQESNEK